MFGELGDDGGAVLRRDGLDLRRVLVWRAGLATAATFTRGATAWQCYFPLLVAVGCWSVSMATGLRGVGGIGGVGDGAEVPDAIAHALSDGVGEVW